MISRRRLLSFLLPLLAALALVPTATAGEDECLQGAALGRWQLPDDGRLGQAHGLLVDQRGRPFLGLRALLARRGTDGEHVVGELGGSLVSLGDDPRRLARIVGRWRSTRSGQDRFEAAILLPDGEGEWEVVGKLRGRFRDRPGDDRPGGFAAHWVGCPR